MPNDREIRTTCPYCGVGCGVLARVHGDGHVEVRGDPNHPANFGRLCSKGSALAETLGPEERLLYPEIEGVRVTWSEALDRVAGAIRNAVSDEGPDSVAFYLSGQLLTEDYYVANKLMKGFIGSANVDTNSRLCMSSAVAGYQRAFGADAVPCNYEDLENADLVVLVGSNMAWCHPVLYQRLAKAKSARPEMKVVVIDPRRTETTDLADLHLAIEPGSDAFLFNGLLTWLNEHNRSDRRFLRNHVEGTKDALEAARASSGDIDTVSERCGLPRGDVNTFFRWFSATEKVVTAYSQGINQSATGSDKNNAIINCHLLTGRLGKPGAGPFSLTGQPNAMGGREVGGLATQLAAHMGFEKRSIETVRRFWNASAMASSPGLKALELVEAIETGKVRVLWVMGTNPVVSLPDAERFRRALRKLELLVVSDCVSHTDTLSQAHIRLPALGWGEKDGTVTNSERCISRQRAFLPAPGHARADWWIVSEIARRLGFGAAFSYLSPADIFREHAALSGFDNAGKRAFDISALMALDEHQYEELGPVQWPVTPAHPAGTQRLFGDSRFFTPNGRARLLPVKPESPTEPNTLAYPLRMNTGRVRDHWHTLTRTGRSPRLSRHTDEPYVQIHPDDADRFDIRQNGLVRVSSRLGELLGRARIDRDQRPGQLFIPIHWSDQFAARARVGTLIPARADPFSGQPETKTTPVNLSPYRPKWFGLLLSREPHEGAVGAPYWVKARGTACWRYRLAGESTPAQGRQRFRQLFGRPKREWLEYFDEAAQVYRAASVLDDRLEAYLYLGAEHALPEYQWVEQLFLQHPLTAADRMALLSGRPPGESRDMGKTVCACHGVTESVILEAIQERGIDSVEAIGAHLKAGTQCGSCIPELKRLLSTMRSKVA